MGAVVSTSGGIGRALAATPETAVANRLRDLLTHRASAARIGRAYLESEPHEADVGLLVRDLAADWPGGPAALAELPETTLARLVSDRTRRDFAEGETVMLDGWVLSRTELRLCALTAIPVP